MLISAECIDSLCYHIRHQNIYKVMRENIELFDTSDYLKNDLHNLYSDKNARVVGKFKDEFNSRAALEFAGLRSKMYSLFVNKNGDKPKLTAKGVKKSYVRHHVTHDMYFHTLFTQESSEASFASIRSINHRLQTLQHRKTCLSAFDDKRFILSDGVSTSAYGHYLIGTPNYK